MSTVHLIKPVAAGPVLTEEDLAHEQVNGKSWPEFVEYAMLPPLEEGFAADTMTQLGQDAETSLNHLQNFISENHKQHLETHKPLAAASSRELP